MDNTEFRAFNKIPRFFRDIIITEKIDGTNAQIYIPDEDMNGENIVAGSRSRWLTVESDNYGFARWVRDNEKELNKLGPGRHFGEWWGSGIQRKYGLTEKRFSLFNWKRWAEPGTRIPNCVYVVPMLYEGPFSIEAVDKTLQELSLSGSRAALGFMNPEGVVILHTASGQLFKYTLDGDGHKTIKER